MGIRVSMRTCDGVRRGVEWKEWKSVEQKGYQSRQCPPSQPCALLHLILVDIKVGLVSSPERHCRGQAQTTTWCMLSHW